MDRYKTVIIIFILTAIFGCGVPDEQYRALQNQNAALQMQVDTLTSQINDLKFGASPLLKKAQLAIEDEKYDSAKFLLTNITDKYYSSREAFAATRLLKIINPKIETIFFNKAKSDSGISLMKSYVEQYPDGKFINEAESFIEEKSWETLNTNSKFDLESFINIYPNSVHIDEAKNLVIRNEVNDVFQSGNYRQLPPLTRDYNSTLDAFSESSKVTIENSTSYLLTILYSGPEQRKVIINNNDSKNVWLKNGSYRIVAYLNASNVSNYAGEEELNGVYSSSYYISTSYSPSKNFYN